LYGPDPIVIFCGGVESIFKIASSVGPLLLYKEDENVWVGIELMLSLITSSSS